MAKIKKRRTKSTVQRLQRRLNRIKGQLVAIDRMLEKDRYCVDIINLSKAAQSALKSFDSQLLETHLKECVQSAFKSKNKRESKKKIREIIALI